MSHYTVVVVYLLSLCISSALFSQFPVGGGLMSHYTVVVVYFKAESVYFFRPPPTGNCSKAEIHNSSQ